MEKKAISKEIVKAGGITTASGATGAGIAAICTTTCTIGLGAGPIGAGIGLVVGLGIYTGHKILKNKKQKKNKPSALH